MSSRQTRVRYQDVDPDEAYEAGLGDGPPWTWAIPLVQRWLLLPHANAPLPAVPVPGAPHAAALGYWTALLEVMLFSLGWADPLWGLEAWRRTATAESTDPRSRLLAQYDEDGSLDLFEAWLDSFPSGTLMPADLATQHRTAAAVASASPALTQDQQRRAQALGLLSPVGGGYDPLHLSLHATIPAHEPIGQGTFLQSTTEKTASLTLDHRQGWYRQLALHGQPLVSRLSDEWTVDVVVRPVGYLGRYRRSLATGLWFSGPHRLHALGNAC